MKNNAKRVPRIFLGASALVLALGISTGLSWLWWANATAPTRSRTGAVTVQVPEGASADSIGRQLEREGLIRSLMAWKLWARLAAFKNDRGSFQTGTYELSAQASLDDLAKTIWTGQVKQTTFTIPEGWSLREMGAYFEKEGWFSADAFLKAAAQVPRDRFAWLPEDLSMLEGFLFPDTYQVPVEGRSPDAVIDVMLEHFETHALPLYQQRQGLKDLSLNEWVTLSSIVEKEAVVARERPLIAGVFWNRLRLGMSLGSDPTVEYGLGIRQTQEQPLTFAQVGQPSPYNTYINPGLPPTPIASPGLASLKAVLTPEQTPYLYFVARYDGTHVFSESLGDHERAQGTIRDQQDAKRLESGKI
ncbi:endolytic transglycosylase MltG [Altericista sp. CCNU0014]|uniref:endolytic transglycosylase MltG n=1 Tax=Altericista sp. CCNU0014 TaxID=3082949 RepID=UPI00384C2174